MIWMETVVNLPCEMRPVLSRLASVKDMVKTG